MRYLPVGMRDRLVILWLRPNTRHLWVNLFQFAQNFLIIIFLSNSQRFFWNQQTNEEFFLMIASLLIK